VLLAAGAGTRLAPLTDSIPKILAPLDGETLLDRQLTYLQAQGVDRVTVNTHHRAAKVVEHLRERKLELDVEISHEPAILGTAGALVPVKDRLKADDFIVLYGDVVTNVDLQALMRDHRRGGAIATLVVTPVADPSGKGVCEVDSRGHITGFVEKPPAGRGPALVNAGLHAIRPDLLAHLPSGLADFGHDVWPGLLERNEILRAWETAAYVLDIGSPSALEQANRDIREGLLRW